MNGLHCNVGAKSLRASLPDQHKAKDERPGNQDTCGDTHHILIEISQVLTLSRKSPAECHTGRISGCRGGEHHKNDHQHLAQIRKPGFTGIMLQVCVCHKAYDRIEGKGRLHCLYPVWIQKQYILQSQYQISRKNHNCICHEKAQCICFPIHTFSVNPADSVYPVVHPVKKRVRKCFLFGRNVIHVSPHGNDRQNKNCQSQRYL